MSFEFKNWKKFRSYMKEEGISLAKFEFKYYTCVFDIIYGIEQNVFFVAKKGTQISFRIDLDWYKASIILDKEPYRELVNCKDEFFNSNHPYSPIDFLKLLDNSIGNNPIIVKVTPQELHFATKNTILDEEKIYFQRFMPHISGERHVTGVNIKKVRKILGRHIADFCQQNNVSVAFTNLPTEKSFEMVKNPRRVLNEQNDL